MTFVIITAMKERPPLAEAKALEPDIDSLVERMRERDKDPNAPIGLLAERLKGKPDKESVEKTADEIKTLSADELADLMIDMASPEKTGEDVRDNLSQEIVDALMERAFQTSERLSKKEDDNFIFMSAVEDALDTRIAKRKNAGDEAPADRELKAFIKLAPKYPEASAKFFKVFGQGGFEIARPDLLIEGVADLNWRPEVDQELKTDLLHALNYVHAFDDKKYLQSALEKNLDFENRENFFKTATFLEFMASFYALSRSWSFSENASSKIQNLLEKVVQRNKGSYLLNARAREIYGGITGKAFTPSDKRPFLLQPGLFAIEMEDGVHTAPSLKEDEVKRRAGELAMAETRGDLREVAAKAEEMKKLFTRKLTPDDLVIARFDRTSEENKALEQDMFDYRYLTRPYMRYQLEDDFHLRLDQFSLQEQFYFLKFIKQKNSSQMKQVKEFSETYGLDGLRALIFSEYGEGLGDIAVELGGKIPEENAKEIFREYGRIISGAESIAAALAEENMLKNIEFANLPQDIKEDFRYQMQEAILRRAKDILFAASEAVENGEVEKRISLKGRSAVLKTDIGEVREALSQYSQALEKVAAMVGSQEHPAYEFALTHSETGEPESYAFETTRKSDGKISYLILQLRSHGTAEPNTEREFGGEARINFLFADGPIALDINEESRQKALSIRIDREGLLFDQKRNITGVDPMLPDGQVSLDLGSFEDVLGRVVSIGNSIYTEKEKKISETNPQYYHNRESFSRALGQKEVFASIVELVRRKIKENYSSGSAKSA